MDTRDTPEQAELRRAARHLAGELSATTVADLEDGAGAARLAAAVREAGWLELRDDDGNDEGEIGGPLASGVEATIIAEALGGTAAAAAFAGPILAGDLIRRVGGTGGQAELEGAVVAFSPGLVGAAVVAGGVTTTPLYAVDVSAVDVDSEHANAAYVLIPDGDGDGYRLGSVALDAAAPDTQSTDLTRDVRVIPVGTAVVTIADQQQLVTDDDLAQWAALGLALTSADLVGVMRGVLAVTVAYAAERKQYGVPVGSFQAVQHLLADARCLMEGSLSVALHASWAVDSLPPADAVEAGRVAKAYCARAARTVCETAIQVHGGIGNTWECFVHVYLRRALLSTQWFGDDGEQLAAIARTRLGASADRVGA